MSYQSIKINIVSLERPDTVSNTRTTYKSSKCLFKLREKSVKWTVLAHFGFQPRGQNFQAQT